MTTNPFVEQAANVLAAASYECSQAPDQWRAMAHRLEEHRLLVRPVETVQGAHPVAARRTGLMVEPDLSAQVGALLRALASQFTQNPEGVGERVTTIADLTDAAWQQYTLNGRGTAEHESNEKVTRLLNELGGAMEQFTAARLAARHAAG